MKQKTKPASRYFRVGKVSCQSSGMEVEVDADATEDEIENAIYEAVAVNLDYGFEEIEAPTGKTRAYYE